MLSSGCRVQIVGLGFMVLSSGFRVQGVRVRAQGSGVQDLRVPGLIDSELVVWEGCCESRGCSKDTHSESSIFVYEDQGGRWTWGWAG